MLDMFGRYFNNRKRFLVIPLLIAWLDIGFIWLWTPVILVLIPFWIPTYAAFILLINEVTADDLEHLHSLVWLDFSL